MLKAADIVMGSVGTTAMAVSQTGGATAATGPQASDCRQVKPSTAGSDSDSDATSASSGETMSGASQLSTA